MHLVYISHTLPPVDRPLDSLGGMQRVSMELLGAFKRRADQDPSVLRVTPLVLSVSWRWIHVMVVPFLLWTAIRLWWLVRREGVDAVLCTSMVSASPVVLTQGILRRKGVRSAAISHGLDVTAPVSIYQWWIRRIFAAIDVLLPVSRATGEASIDAGMDAQRVQVISNGVDVDRLGSGVHRLSARASIRTEFGFSPNAHVLVNVGRQVRRKGVAWFVRSVMPRLPEDVVLLVVGEGPEMADIAQAIDERGLNNRVRLAGRVDESMLMRALAGSDVFVMPNIPVAGDMEGFGVVMLEAGLLDLPTVASGIEGILDVITDGVNGLLVAPGDEEGFAEAIRRCLSATALADDRATGGNGTASAAFAPGSIRAHVRSTFSWDAVSGRYLAALRS